MTCTRQGLGGGWRGWAVLALTLLAGGGTFAPAQGAERKPSIFEATPNPSGPNDTVLLVGEQFDEDAVYLYRLPDTSVAALVAAVGNLAEAASIPVATRIAPTSLPATALVKVPATARSDISLAGVIPADMAAGQYVIWARNGGTWSNAVTINRTEVYFVYPDQVNVALDRQVRVIGQSLGVNEKQPPVVVLRGADGQTYPMTLQVVQPYNLEFKLPESLPLGKYEVWVSNGYGGAYGWSAPQTLTVVNQPRATAEFPITKFGASTKLDDNQQAIQAAIDAARDAGGGVVTVPAGRFVIRGALHLPGGVTLRGLGDFAADTFPSEIKYYEDPQHIVVTADKSHMIDMAGDTVIEGVRLTGSKSVDRAVTVLPGASDVVFRNNYIDAFFITCVKTDPNPKSWHSGLTASGNDNGVCRPIRRLTVVDNKLDGRTSIAVENVQYARIAGNMIYCRMGSPTVNWGSSCTITENNRVDGRDIDGTEGGYRGFYFIASSADLEHAGFGPVEKNYVADNLIEFVGTWHTYRDNNGEYVTFDNIGSKRYAYSHFLRPVAAATADTVTVHNVNYSDGQPSPWEPDQLIKSRLVVVQGRGLGQMRDIAANTANTVTVTPTWTVPPDATSQIVIARYFDRNILYRNIARNNKGNAYQLWGLGAHTIMDNNSAAQGGSTIDGCENTNQLDQFAFAYYNVIQDSYSPTATIEFWKAGDLPTRATINMLGNVVRRNVVTQGLALNRMWDKSPLVINARANMLENNRTPQAVRIADNATETVQRDNLLQPNP